MNNNWKSCLIAAAALIAVATIHAQSSGTYTVHNLAINNKSGVSSTFATTTGARTTGKQLAFDSNGDIIASDDNLGGGGSGGTFQSTITDLKATHSATVLTVAPGYCWNIAKSSSMTATKSTGSGSGSYAVYCNKAGAVIVEHSTSAGMTYTVSGLIDIQVTTPACREFTWCIATGTITSGSFDAPTDKRSATQGFSHTNGTGMNVQCTNGDCIHAVDSAVVQLKSDPVTPVSSFSAAAATSTKPFRETTSDPGSCSANEWWYRTDTGELKRCVGGVATVVGGSSVATHTYFAPVRCSFLDSVVMSDYWQDPKNAVAKPAAAGCSDGTQFGRGNLNWSNSTTQYMFLVFPIPLNRTGAVDFDIYGFDLGGSGSFTFDISKMCSTDSTDWAAAESWTDTQSITWTSTNTNVVKRSITNITLPSDCSTGNWLVIRLTRNNTATAATAYYMRGARAVMRTN